MSTLREPVPTVPDGTVHLTFDDGPDPTWTPRVLEALAAVDAHATFFVLGDAVRRHPELVERTVAAGHRVGLHADRHVRHTELTTEEIDADAAAALAALRDVGVAPTWWRTPWGIRTPGTAAVAAARGLRLVGWHADTHDWRGDGADALLAAVRADASSGGIVLAHDGLGPGARRTGCGETVALIGAVAAWARRAGMILEALPGASSGRPAAAGAR